MEYTQPTDWKEYERNVALAQEVVRQVNQVVLGKPQEVREVLLTFLAGGHVLLEDIPGVGKTTLATAFSKAMRLECKRVQFTPDVMPSDLTGFSVYRREEEKFVTSGGASSATCSWRTKSTGRRQRPSPRCLKSWRSGRFRSKG